jgi:lipoyl(octanoyl) transferase
VNIDVTYHDLGRVHYRAGERIQELLEQDTRLGNRQHLIALEHNPVFTFGKNADRSNLLWDKERLILKRIQLFETSRGGDITYHGPGQIVIYPIVNLQKIGITLGDFVRGLEESMIRTADRFGIRSQRIKGNSGVWVKTNSGFSKLGALGLHVSKWITTHGIAFNVNPELGHYLGINPCGFEDRGVVSIYSLLENDAPSIDEVKNLLVNEIRNQFGLKLLQSPSPTLSISVIVYRETSDGIEILMMRRVPRDGGWWQSVTGMIDPEESKEHAAGREVFEETGLTGDLIDLDYQHTFVLPKPQLQLPYIFNVEHCFIFKPSEPLQPVRLSPLEHDSYRWVTVEEAKLLTPWDGMRIALDRLIDRIQK